MAGKTSSMRDMTSGSPTRLILEFAIPMLLGTLFQQFYSMVDTIIVGRMLGVDALAGVGSTGAINFMVNGFVIGACAGFAIPVAQRFGAQDFRGLRKYVAQIIYLTVIIALLMTVVISVLTKPILEATNTPLSIFSYAYDYIFIIFVGTPMIFLYNITASIIRSLGDAKTPVYFLIFAALLNIVLDLISIGLMGFGVDGPAYATVISQGLSGILCLLYMIRRFPVLHLEKEDMKPDRERSIQLLRMGIPRPGFPRASEVCGADHLSDGDHCTPHDRRDLGADEADSRGHQHAALDFFLCLRLYFHYFCRYADDFSL